MKRLADGEHPSVGMRAVKRQGIEPRRHETLRWTLMWHAWDWDQRRLDEVLTEMEWEGSDSGE